ncbi:MAG: hypothetical protein Q4G04_02900 [bacterium]|nr:hypothetical protein [bacterium]
MELNDASINSLIQRCILLIDELDLTYHYPSNTKHLLYLIITSFILKYGLKNEKMIISALKEIQIIVNQNEIPDNLVAHFERKILFDEDGKPYTRKKIVIDNYFSVPTINLLDSVIHEFNHAINSYKKEMSFTNEQIILRCGLSTSTFDKNNLVAGGTNKKNVYLEEVINTYQTEEIINIIASLANMNIENEIINNTLYVVNSELNGQKYESEAYYLQNKICRSLIENKTFINTVSSLRLSGDIFDIEKWFNNIVYIDNAFEKLSTLLDKISQEEVNYSKIKLSLFRKRKLKTIKNMTDEVFLIINEFNNNCSYK